MKIIKPCFIIETEIDGEAILRRIEIAGRTAYKSKIKNDRDSTHRFVRKLIKLGHLSVIEHENVTVRVICDRAIAHQIVRHRIASYTQESTRYCNYTDQKFGEEICVIEPFFWEKNGKKYKIWEEAMKLAENAYKKLVSLGESAEKARNVLPLGLKTEIVMTMNLREWRHFFSLRTSKEAHPQMREIAIPLLHEFKNRIPEIFDSIDTDN